MGDVNGNPTTKECEGALRKESFKLSSIKPTPNIMFSSTGSIKFNEPTPKGPIDYYANPITTWCANYGEWGYYLAP